MKKRLFKPKFRTFKQTGNIKNVQVHEHVINKRPETESGGSRDMFEGLIFDCVDAIFSSALRLAFGKRRSD